MLSPGVWKLGPGVEELWGPKPKLAPGKFRKFLVLNWEFGRKTQGGNSGPLGFPRVLNGLKFPFSALWVNPGEKGDILEEGGLFVHPGFTPEGLRE